METLQRLVDELCELGSSTPKHVVEYGRSAARRNGLQCNPVGVGNSKTRVPSTYRPVGATCPACPYEKECYALGGHVRTHQVRASAEVEASLTAAAIAMTAAAKGNVPARLHVSGDFVRNGDVDLEYVLGLARLADVIRTKTGRRGCLAWSYTHIPEARFELYRLLLARHGIEVLYSDSYSAGGAVVFPFEHLEQLRAEHPQQRFARCRAQLDEDVSCADCGLCWEAHAKGLTIVFDPHGHGRASLRTRIAA